MARALSEGTDEHSAEEFAAELERCGATLDAHADHPGVRVSLEVPASRLDKALGAARRGAARARLPRRRDQAAGRQPARRDPARAGQPRPPGRRWRCPRSSSRPRRGTPGRARAPRTPSARIDAAAVRAFYRAHVRPATATAVVVGDLTGIDLPALLDQTARPLDRHEGRAAPAPGDHRGRHRARGDRGPAGLGADAVADRPDRRRPARPGVGRAGARHLLPRRHPHLPAGPGAARGEGLHLRGARLRPGAAVLRRTARARRCWPSAVRSPPR